MQADAVHDRDAQRPAHHLGTFLQLRIDLVILLQDFAAGTIQDLAGGRGLGARTAALEQLAMILRFERAQLLTDRGLRNEVLRCGG